jgi:SAM-dependent methyltransferase
VPDFGRTAEDYARHRAGFPPLFADRLQQMGIARPGARVVDIGTGTGSLARLLAQRGCAVTGVDIAAPMLEQARRLDSQAGVQVRYIHARAERTGLPDRAFDLACAGQCWPWFDRPAAARELRRLLVPAGAAVIAHFDWLALPGNVVEATEQLIMRHSPDWQFAGGTGIYPQWLGDLQCAGFEQIETFSFDVAVSYAHADWVGRLRASGPIAGTLDAGDVRAFSCELERMLRERFAGEPLQIPHRVWAVTARAPS